MKGQALAQHESDAAPWQTPASHNSSCWLQPGRKHSRRSSTVLLMGISDLGVGMGSLGGRAEEEADSGPGAPPATGLASSTSTGGWCKF